MPTDSTYVFGSLRMPQEAHSVSDAIPSIWQSDPLMSVLIILSIILFLFSLNNILNILPCILKSLFNFKAGITIESGIQYSRPRDMAALSLIVPFILLTDRLLPSGKGLVFCLAVISGYLAVRYLLFRMSSYRLYAEEHFVYSSKCVNNYFIILCILWLISLGIVTAFDIGPDAARQVILIESIVTYTLCIARRFHFLVSSHSGFSSFLYLCVLEFLPTGILIILWLR